jgi:hypothetical protein
MLDPYSESRDPKTITTRSGWCFLKHDPIHLWKWIHQAESEEEDGAGLVSSCDIGFSAGSRKNSLIRLHFSDLSFIRFFLRS